MDRIEGELSEIPGALGYDTSTRSREFLISFDSSSGYSWPRETPEPGSGIPGPDVGTVHCRTGNNLPLPYGLRGAGVGFGCTSSCFSIHHNCSTKMLSMYHPYPLVLKTSRPHYPNTSPNRRHRSAPSEPDPEPVWGMLHRNQATTYRLGKSVIATR